MDELFKKALHQYNSLLRYTSRKWSNRKWHEDDLFSEATIVLLKIVRHHSDLGIESTSFERKLRRSVKNRFVDLYRETKTQGRDGIEHSYDLTRDDMTLIESWAACVVSFRNRPDEVAEAMDLAEKLMDRLTAVDRQMLDQLIEPDDALLEVAKKRDEEMRNRSGKRSQGSKTDIPVALMGESIGLSYKQSLSSLNRIRHHLDEILRASGMS